MESGSFAIVSANVVLGNANVGLHCLRSDGESGALVIGLPDAGVSDVVVVTGEVQADVFSGSGVNLFDIPLEAVTDLQTVLDTKQSVITSNSVSISAVANLQTVLNTKQAVLTSNSVPISAVANLQPVLDTKQPVITGAASSVVSNNLLAGGAVVVTDKDGKLSANVNIAISAVANLQSALDAKQNASASLTASRVVVSDATGNLATSGTTTTTLGYLDASSSVQSQLDNRLARNVDTWHTSADGNARMYFGNGGRSYFSSLSGFEWRYHSGSYLGSLDTGGNFAVPGNMTAYSSDKRLKTNLRPICESALEAVAALEGVRFEWTDEAPAGMRGATDVSLLAQDVFAVLPEAVAPAPFDTDTTTGESLSGKKYLTLKMHHQLTALLVEAIKELRQEVRALQRP